MKAFSMLLCLGLAAVITCDAWAKRSEPKKVTPVMYEGVKYIAPHVNGREGKTEALNQETGEKLWDKVIYTVKAAVDITWGLDKNAEETFFVCGLVDLEEDRFSEPVEVSETTTFGCLCCETGPLSIDAKVDRNGFVSGETATVHARVNTIC